MSKPPPPTIDTAAISRCPNNDGHIVAAAYRNSTFTEWELDLVITSLNWCSAKTRLTRSCHGFRACCDAASCTVAACDAQADQGYAGFVTFASVPTKGGSLAISRVPWMRHRCHLLQEVLIVPRTARKFLTLP